MNTMTSDLPLLMNGAITQFESRQVDFFEIKAKVNLGHWNQFIYFHVALTRQSVKFSLNLCRNDYVCRVLCFLHFS